jgi:rhamnosyltransferase
MSRAKICAIIVSWNPNVQQLNESIRSLESQVDSIYIVDNGTDNFDSLVSGSFGSNSLRILQLNENYGIGFALNKAISLINLNDFDWILTLDQDSVLKYNAVSRLFEDFSSIPIEQRKSCGVLSLKSENQPINNYFVRSNERLSVINTQSHFRTMNHVISSGSFVKSEVFLKIKYNEEFFIDQVDFDFCVSVRRSNYQILQQNRISLNHVLGSQLQWKSSKYSYHADERLYYIIRNSTNLFIRGRQPLHYYVNQLAVWIGSFLLTNGPKSLFRLIRLIVFGMIDGIFSRLGKNIHKLSK